MKLSAWHKGKGDVVEWFSPMFKYDRVYSSKVFTFSPDDPYLPEGTVKGGSGYGLSSVELPPEAEYIMPDYDLYKTQHSLGFLTRGCDRNCAWCIVPRKEGKTHAHTDIEEFTAHNKVVLLDNNVLQSAHGIEQIEKISRLGLRVDFNQGLDARLIDDAIARLLGRVKWIRHIRLACDHKGQIPAVEQAVRLLRWHNANPAQLFSYVLVKQDVEDALDRVRFLKGMYVLPFAQPYIDKDGTPPTAEQRHFARWCNHRAEYKSRTWEDYRASHIAA